MITRLKNRPRLDALDNQRRGAGRKLGRRVYLGSLYTIGAVFAYFFFGSFFILDSDGLVMRDQFFVESTFPAKVLHNHVQPGAKVKKGDLLVTLQSQEVLDSIARVSAQQADLIAQESQLKGRAVSILDLVPVAKSRYLRAKKNMAKIEKLDNRGLITNATRNQATELLYATQREYTQLKAEADGIETEIKNIVAAREGLDDAISRLKDAYGDGEVRAQTDGVVGPKVAAPGEVFNVSETIMEILSGETYILVYIPTSRFYSVEEGQTVIVSDGGTKAKGIISKMGDVTDALPPEFQGAFSTTERLQIVTVRFPGKAKFVLKAKVKVSGQFGLNGAMVFIADMLFGDGEETMVAASEPKQRGIENLISENDNEELVQLAALDDGVMNDVTLEALGVELPFKVDAPTQRPDLDYIQPIYRSAEQLRLFQR